MSFTTVGECRDEKRLRLHSGLLIVWTAMGLLTAPLGIAIASSVLSMSGSLCIALSGRRHVARQGSDPLQPGTHRREGSQVVAALRAEARVHIEGDVCDRGVLTDE